MQSRLQLQSCSSNCSADCITDLHQRWQRRLQSCSSAALTAELQQRRRQSLHTALTAARTDFNKAPAAISYAPHLLVIPVLYVVNDHWSGVFLEGQYLELLLASVLRGEYGTDLTPSDFLILESYYCLKLLYTLHYNSLPYQHQPLSIKIPSEESSFMLRPLSFIINR